MAKNKQKNDKEGSFLSSQAGIQFSQVLFIAMFAANVTI